MIIEVIGVRGSGKSTLYPRLCTHLEKAGHQVDSPAIVYPAFQMAARKAGYEGKFTARTYKDVATNMSIWTDVMTRYGGAYQDFWDVAGELHKDPKPYLRAAQKWLCVSSLLQDCDYKTVLWDKGLFQVLIKMVVRSPNITSEQLDRLVRNWPLADRYVYINVDVTTAYRRAKARTRLPQWDEDWFLRAYLLHYRCVGALSKTGAKVCSVDNGGVVEDFDMEKALFQ